METIAAAYVNADELSKIEDVAETFPKDSVLRSAVDQVSSSVRSGRDVLVAEESDLMSPALAAKIIGVSRTHLYKLLDNGELPSVPVGRDRRIAFADVRGFLAAQDEVRRETAERFAHADSVREAALRRYKTRGK